MILSNLLLATLMSCAIATSTNAGGNFNIDDKKQNQEIEKLEPIKKNATANIEITDFYQAQRYGSDYKYYIGTQNSPNYNYENIINVTNSIYNFNNKLYTAQNNRQDTMSVMYMVMKINPYLGLNNVLTTLTGTSRITIQTNQAKEVFVSYNYYIKKGYDNQLEPYINMTLNDNSYNNIKNLVNTYNWTSTGSATQGNYNTTAGETFIHDWTYSAQINVEQDTQYLIIRLSTEIKNVYPTDTICYLNPKSINYYVNYNPSTITYEVINIPALIFNILTLPFSFISQAFNLTLFPNTPYQVNIANIILVVIAAFILIFVIRLLLRALK